MEESDNLDLFQTEKGHGMEKTLLSLVNIGDPDGGTVYFLVLLDILIASRTIKHVILLNCLKECEVQGTALW